MADPHPGDEGEKPAGPPQEPPLGFKTDLPATMTLETLIELTGEMDHLNELVIKSLERDGGFTSTEAYFTTVQPILDLLEVEIRVRYRPGMCRNEWKLILQDWIDGEIRLLR